MRGGVAHVEEVALLLALLPRIWYAIPGDHGDGICSVDAFTASYHNQMAGYISHLFGG